MHNRRGFTVLEGAALAIVAGALLAVVQPAFEGTRRGARAQTSADNLRFWGVASETYINDFGGLLPAYSWQPGQVHHFAGWLNQPEGGIRTLPSNPIVAYGLQETDVLRRHTGRATGARKIRELGFSGVLFPNRRRTHLVLADHIGLSVTSPRAADPNDGRLLEWQRDPIAYEDAGVFPQSTCNESIFSGGSRDNPVVQRWPYSSSYRVVPATYAQDAMVGSLSTLSLDRNTPNLFNRGDLPYGGRRADDVAFASQKVFMYSWHDRHSSDQGLWYAYPEARAYKLMFDGSVNDWATGESNPGVDSDDPDNPESADMRYCPMTTDPPPVGDPYSVYNAAYRWTRGGLAGIDYTP